MTNPKSDGTESTLVTIRTFINEFEANLAKAALETEGIKCMIGRDDCGGLRPSLSMANGIRLIVRSEDADRAEKILANEGHN
jgi:putative signal transducing protein